MHWIHQFHPRFLDDNLRPQFPIRCFRFHLCVVHNCNGRTNGTRPFRVGRPPPLSKIYTAFGSEGGNRRHKTSPSFPWTSQHPPIFQYPKQFWSPLLLSILPPANKRRPLQTVRIFTGKYVQQDNTRQLEQGNEADTDKLFPIIYKIL